MKNTRSLLATSLLGPAAAQARAQAGTASPSPFLAPDNSAARQSILANPEELRSRREGWEMRRRLVSLTLALLSLLLFVSCQSLGPPVSLEGHWDGSITLRGQRQAFVFDLRKTATEYGGYIGFVRGDIYEVQLARVRGKDVEIIARFLGLATMTLLGTLSGNKIRGNVTANMLGTPYSGTFEMTKTSDTPQR